MRHVTWWSNPGTARTIAVAGLVAVSPLLGVTESASAADGPPSRVVATYKITFAGAQIGSFSFESSIEGAAYRTSGAADLSLLLGAAKWQAKMASTGTLTSGGTSPSTFSQELVSKRHQVFQVKKKAKSVKLAFANGAVSAEEISPPRKTDGRVPIEPGHLSGVLDPAGAVVALTLHAGRKNPCDRRLPVFDGERRFDLVLAAKGREASRGSRAGQTERAYVCSVRYVPVAGHKIEDAENQDLQRRTDIEVVLQPVTGADVLVPVDVRVPTQAGMARLVADKIEVTTARRQRIALLE